MTQLSYEQVRDEFKQLVDENPDFVYRPPNGSDCLYVHVDGDNMAPGCIVGHWLHRFRSIPLYRLQGIEGNNAAPGASMDGQVASSTTYLEWLGRQDAATKADILGPGRARLLESGKISLSDLVDQRGNELTLADLRKR